MNDHLRFINHREKATEMLGLFLQSNAAAVIGGMNLSDEVTRHCAELLFKGYTIVRSNFSGAECARAIKEFRAFESSNEEIFAENRDEFGHLKRIVNLHMVLPAVANLFTANERLLQISDVLFGGRTALYTSLLYECGSEQSIHRDAPLFCTRPEYLYFGNTVYLEAADDQNGCLEVIERGHLVGELNRERIAQEHYGSLDVLPLIDVDLWNKYQTLLVERCRQQQLTRKRIHVAAGDSLIWHPLLPHGGSPILDRTRTRLSVVFHSVPEGVPVYQQDAFFRPSMHYATSPPWGYREADGRKMVDHKSGVSFDHLRNYPFDAFRPLAG